MEVVAFETALGAEIRGVDLSKPMPSSQFEDILSAWHKHLVLLFRDQKITDHQLAAYSEMFGELDVIPSSRNNSYQAYVTGLPEVAVVSNVIENGQSIGALGDGEASWHTDMSYVENPPIGCVLYGVEVPEGQGNTYWSNMYKAYDELADELKSKIKDRHAIHDASHNSTGELRQGFEKAKTPKDVVGARHPIVRIHPETGKPALYLGRRLNGYIEGLPVYESEALLDRLWQHCANPDFFWCHEWKLGDVLMWDNRCTIHRRDAFDPKARRILHRTQIKPAA